MENIFLDIGVLVILAALGALLATFLRQPLIPLYLLVGILIGPVLGLVTNQEVIITFSEIGIALLLFVVGLRIDLGKLKSVAKIAVVGGIVKVGVLALLGFLLANFLDFAYPATIYLGLAVAFGSTMVALKILSDRQELNSLHGRIVIGFLLVEDILAVLALTVLSTLGSFEVTGLLLALVKGIGLLLAVVLASRFVFPWLFRYASKFEELMFILALGFCFGFAWLSYSLGLSIAIGAFFVGVGLANLPYRLAIAGKVRVLRDFFAVIFFVTLGMQIAISDLDLVWKALVIFTLFVIIVNPLTTALITSIFGYKRRTTFMAVVFLIPTSEFALIIVTEGMQRGDIGSNVFALVVMLAVLTITYMSYLVRFDWQIYKVAKWPLKIFESFSREHIERVEIKDGKKKGKQVVLCGVDRLGHKILKALSSMRESILVVDLNPELIEKMARKKIPAIYGDINDPEIFHKTEPKNTKLIISTVPDKHDNLLLLEQTKSYRRSMVVCVTASQARDALELYKHGADYVIVPKHLGGEHVAFLLKKSGNRFGKFKQTKKEHLRELREIMRK
ncbi:hypothetical protein E3J85_02070 [Patescibacteria group bacterium]|nr:MAG: hypothetical protein E3J85_02070 [Patescibacteria group bacterium]